ncbi:hypothetical protein GAYE_SCF24G4343 [Galdieria yellowstonensis]|jgi:hypothetical protein|uniref:Uncharacterized protein n=1 Tax=Galdieria yellowstonensis TaxID=3028027 RepID=A0AAV9IGG8_9RHOD|nr:hypothetical protein GAYE_SCF24G4343 [Galdieria yellowstonensis]
MDSFQQQKKQLAIKVNQNLDDILASLTDILGTFEILGSSLSQLEQRGSTFHFKKEETSEQENIRHSSDV